MSDQPVEKLQPGSWTAAEVRDMRGLRFRLADGREGAVRADGCCYAEDDTIESYVVEFVPDHGATIVCNKQDFQGSEILPGLPLSDEARERLPALGTTETMAMIERLQPGELLKMDDNDGNFYYARSIPGKHFSGDKILERTWPSDKGVNQISAIIDGMVESGKLDLPYCSHWQKPQQK
jgi:hypothetical protein